MLDRYTNKIASTPLKILARYCLQLGITANQITVSGFILGLLTLPALIYQHYLLALVFILINRLFDGLDGTIARQQGATDAGAFLDITLDFLFYSLIPFGFVLANPTQNAVAGAFLIFSFIGTGSSFLAFAIMASKHQMQSLVYPQKSLYYLTGLTESTETILCFILFCFFPHLFPILASIFGGLCWITTTTRIWQGYQHLKIL